MTTLFSNKSPSITLLDLLREQSRDLYDAEKSYSDFLGRMIQTCEDEQLEAELNSIATTTLENLVDLITICDLLDAEPEGVKCEAMAGLLREAGNTTTGYESGAVRDAALIASAQRIAHYQIAGYGTANAFAAKLGLRDVQGIFAAMASRAGKADQALTRVANGSWLSSGINDAAVRGV